MPDIINETVEEEESKKEHHIYGETVVATFEQIERLPTIVIRALTEYINLVIYPIRQKKNSTNY